METLVTDALASLTLDHIGVQVRSLDKAIEEFTTLFGYKQTTQPVLNTEHRVWVVFLEKPGSLSIKLFCPDGAGAPPAQKLHHLAFRAASLEPAIDALVAAGARQIKPPTPGEAFDDEPIAFMFAGGLNVELVATEKRRNRIE